MVNQLPQGWKEEELGKLVDIFDNLRKPVSSTERLARIKNKDKSELYPYYGATGLVDYIDGYIFDGEYLLLGEDGCPFLDSLKDKAYIISGKTWVNNHAHVLRAKENKTSNKFLLYYLNKFDYNGIVSGATRLKLNQNSMKKIPVYYPTDKSEQEYIVKTLDAVAEIIRLRKENIQLTKDLIPAIFHEMFGDPITNPKGWDKKDLGDVCSKITDGSHNPPKGIKEGIFILLSSQNILNNGINTNGCRFVSEDDFIKENKRTKLSYGDILLTIVGTIGRSAIYKKQYENIIFQRSVAVLSPNKKFVNSEYLNAYIQTDFIQNVLQNKAHGVAQLGIYLKDLRKVEVLCPPLSKQEEFADKVEQINKYIATQQEELEHFETLFQSLLQEAFTGILTWNYPRKECHDKKDK